MLRFVWVPSGTVEHPPTASRCSLQQYTGSEGPMKCHCFYTPGGQPGVLPMRDLTCNCPGRQAANRENCEVAVAADLLSCELTVLMPAFQSCQLRPCGAAPTGSRRQWA